LSSSLLISRAEIFAARARLAPHVRVTPLDFSPSLSKKSHHEIFLKLENWQSTGSFKIRGALNKMLTLSENEKRCGVITASAGNHGLGVAYACQLLEIVGKIVVPVNASPAKIQALQHFAVELIQQGNDYDEAEALAWEIQKREGSTFVHAFSDPQVIAGQGTIALEILEALPDAQTIVVPIGGGGLVSGIAIAAKSMNPNIKIIGVQSEASPAMYHSLRAGQVVEAPIGDTIADGLAGRFVTETTLRLVQEFVDEVLLISEESSKAAMRLILETEHLLIEGAAAVGVAALLENKITSPGKTVVVLTGRNIDVTLLKSVL
jgi:threonine dehydratase